MGLVYLLHVDGGLRNGPRVAGHYIGYSEDRRSLEQRLAHHRSGNGARIVRAYNEAGLEWTLARVWEGASRTFERELKNRHEAPRFCPCCSRRSGAAFRNVWPADRPQRTTRFELETMRSGLLWLRDRQEGPLRPQRISGLGVRRVDSARPGGSRDAAQGASSSRASGGCRPGGISSCSSAA